MLLEIRQNIRGQNCVFNENLGTLKKKFDYQVFLFQHQYTGFDLMHKYIGICKHVYIPPHKHLHVQVILI